MQHLQDVFTVHHLSEYSVLPVKPGAWHKCYEELGAVGVRPCIGHGEQSRHIVLQEEVFVGESPTVNGLAASAVMIGEVTALGHEVGDDAVEGRSFIAKTFFMGAECAEVGGSFGSFLVEELEDEFSSFAVPEIYLEEDVFESHWDINNKNNLGQADEFPKRREKRQKLPDISTFKNDSDNRQDRISSIVVLIYLYPENMSTTSINGTISIESHSKQVKLLNDYILSLEKKLNQGRESDSSRMIKLSDQANRLSDQNIKLKNQVAQLKYHLYKHEETARKNAQLQQDFATTTHQLHNAINDKNAIAREYQKLKEHFTNCELHLKAAEKEINDRTELFKKDASHLTDIIEEQRVKLQGKEKRIGELQARMQGETKRMKFQLQKIENISSQRIKQKNQTINGLTEQLQQTKKGLDDKMQQLAIQARDNEDKNKIILQKNNDISALVRENANLTHKLDQSLQENKKLQNHLSNKTQEYNISHAKDNEEKSNLIRIIRRLEEEKKMLQSVNSAAKGDVSLQIQQNRDLIRQNEALSAQLSEAKNLIIKLRQDQQALNKSRQQLFEQLKAVLQNLNRTEMQRDEERGKVDQLQKFCQKQARQLGENIEKLENQLNAKQFVIEKLNGRAQEMEVMIDALRHQKEQANSEIARIMQMMNSKQLYFQKQISQLEEQLMRRRQQIKNRQQFLSSLKAEYLAFQSKKEGEIETLNTRINNFISDQSLLKNQSDSTTKDFLNFKQAKEAEILSLNQNLKELSKEKTIFEKELQKVKQEYSLFKKRKESEVDDLNSRLRDIQKDHSTLKDSLDTLNREYYTYQKKKETDIDHLNDKNKELIKKLQKREMKIQQLEHQKRQVEAIYETSKKNMTSSQQEELERLKEIYLTQNTSLKNQISEATQRSEELAAERQELQRKVGQLEEQLKGLKDELRSKEKSHAEIQRSLQKERNELLDEIKSLNISTVLAGQIKSSKQIQIDSLKKANSNLENFIAENKRHLESLSALLKQKEKELETLESSNAMLRKQLISSLNNQQNSRKEVVEIRRTGSVIMPPSQRMRLKTKVTQGKTTNSPELTLSKAGRYANSIVESREGSNSRDKGLKTFNTKSSIIDDISLEKDEQQLPVRESNRNQSQKLHQI